MRKTGLLALLLSSAFFCSHAQSLAINTDGSTANTSALLDVKSTTKGVLVPRMTKAQRNAIASPAGGLVVYVNAPDTTGFCFFNGSEWKWIETQNTNNWSIAGNAGTNEATHFIGTTDNANLSFRINGFERMKLSGEGAVGIGQLVPKYPLDINAGQAGVVNCSINGIRVKDVGIGSNDCDQGLVLGFEQIGVPSNEAYIWNYGQPGNNNVRSINLGGGSVFRMARFTSDGMVGLNSGITSPQYALDVNTGMAAINPCTRNGLRLLMAANFGNNSCDNGLFLGFDNNSNQDNVSLWNLSSSPAGTGAIRFGFGADFFPSFGYGFGEVMRILPPGKGVGIGTANPLAMLHITNYTGGGAMPGVMVTNPMLAPGTNGYYMGLQISGSNADDGYLWNYRNAAIRIGTGNMERITLTADGFVGIGTNVPTAPLQFEEAYSNYKIVLHNNNHGNLPDNQHDFYGFGVNSGVLRYQIPRSFTAHVFYAGDINGTSSKELMRITGEGYVGIGQSNPRSPLQFFDANQNRKLVLADFGSTNENNFFGLGTGNEGSTGVFRYQTPYHYDDHVFFSGSNDGSSSNELFRIKGGGDIGAGTNFPVAYGHGGTNRIFEIKNTITPGSNIQTHIILSSIGSSGSLGGLTWAGLNLTGEQRTGFIGNEFETAAATRLVFYTRTGGGALTEKFNIQSNGNAVLQGILTQVSDARLKKDIHPLGNPLHQLEQLNGYTYHWKDSNRDPDEQIGLLAQEVQKVFPQLVKSANNDELSVNYSGLIPVLLEGLKEQQQQITTQEKRIKALEQQVQQLLNH